MLKWLLCVLLGSVTAAGAAFADIPCSSEGTCEAPLVCDTTLSPALCQTPPCDPAKFSADCPSTWICVGFGEDDSPPVVCGPAPEDSTACTTAQEGRCMPSFLVPCKQTSDCGTEAFECEVKGTNEFGNCEFLELPCEDGLDSSCPQGSECATYQRQPGGECTTLEDDTRSCTEPPPETFTECRPPDWHVLGVFYSLDEEGSGSSGPPPEDDIQANTDTSSANTDTSSANTDTTSTPSGNGGNSDDSGCQVSRTARTRPHTPWWSVAAVTLAAWVASRRRPVAL